MPTLNTDIPVFECLLRREYLYDLREHQGEFTPCTVFGVASIAGRALGFHVLVHETGAVIWRLPISALASREHAPHLPVDQLQLWDCFAYELAVHEFDHLAGRRCQVLLKDGSKIEGRYLFTIDWFGNNPSENAGDGGHKCAHIVQLDNGCYAAQPNNRILWADPAHLAEPFAAVPDYKTNTHTWSVEGKTRWGTEDSDRMFYGVADDKLPTPPRHFGLALSGQAVGIELALPTADRGENFATSKPIAGFTDRLAKHSALAREREFQIRRWIWDWMTWAAEHRADHVRFTADRTGIRARPFIKGKFDV